MATEETGAQVREKHVNAMGDTLGPVFNRLFNECAWLHVKWAEFCALYTANPDRVALLNQAAPNFFRIVQDTLWEDTLLHLARLTDRPVSAGKENLTVQRVPELVDDKTFGIRLQGLVDDAVASAEFARDWRNRRIAHRDLDLQLRKDAEPLAVANRQKVDAALGSLVAIFETMYGHYLNSGLTFHFLERPRDAEGLLYVLRDRLEVEETAADTLRASRTRGCRSTMNGRGDR